jgi:hypothetical protein
MTAFAATHHLGRDWTTTDKGRGLLVVHLNVRDPICLRHLTLLPELFAVIPSFCGFPRFGKTGSRLGQQGGPGPIPRAGASFLPTIKKKLRDNIEPAV